MSVSTLYVRHQFPVIAGLIRAASAPLTRKIRPQAGDPDARPVFEKILPPRPEKLVIDYIRHVGGNPAWYKGALPPHLFPQWGFPLFIKTLTPLPYDFSKALNGGAEISVNSPVPMGEPLHVKVWLEEVDETESRVVFRQRMTTGPKSDPEALVCGMNAIIPKGRGKGGGKKPTVPDNAREIARLRVPESAGLDFALLTGDFNPIHWVPPYARAAGFPNVINHGFSTMARTIESLNRDLWLGRPFRLKHFSCRFQKPLVLPGKAGVFVDDEGGVFTAAAKGATPYLIGEYSTR